VRVRARVHFIGALGLWRSVGGDCFDIVHSMQYNVLLARSQQYARIKCV
jgi:hypothetical protein